MYAIPYVLGFSSKETKQRWLEKHSNLNDGGPGLLGSLWTMYEPGGRSERCRKPQLISDWSFPDILCMEGWH